MVETPIIPLKDQAHSPPKIWHENERFVPIFLDIRNFWLRWSLMDILDVLESLDHGRFIFQLSYFADVDLLRQAGRIRA